MPSEKSEKKKVSNVSEKRQSRPKSAKKEDAKILA
jgi:hypothetical protein